MRSYTKFSHGTSFSSRPQEWLTLSPKSRDAQRKLENCIFSATKGSRFQKIGFPKEISITTSLCSGMEADIKADLSEGELSLQDPRQESQKHHHQKTGIKIILSSLATPRKLLSTLPIQPNKRCVFFNTFISPSLYEFHKI